MRTPSTTAATCTSCSRARPGIADYEKAIALKPDYAEAFYNHGTTLFELRRYDAALAQLNRAIALRPGYAEAFYNRGTTLMALPRIDDALADFAKALALKPDYHEAAWNRGLCNLLVGRWREGWPDYERRWQTTQTPPHWHTCGRPQWTGREDIRGKTLLLHSEQGHGDTIMAARFVRPVIERGARVILDAPPAMRPLLEQIEGITLTRPDEPSPMFDLYCPLMSLPRGARRHAGKPEGRGPVPVGAIRACGEMATAAGQCRRASRSASTGRAIRRSSTTRRARSACNACFRCSRNPACSSSVCRRICVRGTPKSCAAGPTSPALGGEIETFADTAAIISLLDLVISSDTSVVHLAGALGKPVWILLQRVPDWRWLLDREDSPWYPTARLFRQTELGDWSGVIEKVALALRDAAGRFRDAGSR